MNNKIVDERWEVTREELKQFLSKYQGINKLTQDKLQDLFNSLNITYDDLNKVIPKVENERLKRKVKEWKNLGILTGYFKYRVNELMKGNIFYKNLIEILVYGLLIEEKEVLSNNIATVFQTSILDCYNKGRKDLKKKKVNSIPKEIDKTIFNTLIGGITWFDYVDSLVLTNMQEIQKRYLIELQQDKESNIYDDVWQRTLEIQRNRLLSINDDKYSGGLDEYVTAYGNLAYIEAGGSENQLAKFISDLCDNVTDMCSYMDGMIFNTRKRNVFKRPMGKTKKDLLIQEVDVIGLVIGINLPPINEHFHWCHSTITYQIDKSADELRKMIFTNNKELSKLGSSINNSFVKPHKEMKIIDKIDNLDENSAINYLKKQEEKIRNSDIENAIMILDDGTCCQSFGVKDNVYPYHDLQNNHLLRDRTILYMTHNHPKKETSFSFDGDDRDLWDNNENLLILRHTDYKYTSQFSRLDKTVDESFNYEDLFDIPYEMVQHEINIGRAKEFNYGYTRIKNDI